MSQQTNPIELASSTQLMRWARQERTALMASFLQRAAIGIAASLGDCVRYFGNSYAVRLTNCICGMPPGRSSNLMTVF